MVVIDTSVWVRAYRSAQSPEKAVIEELITSGEAAIVGVVLSELLRGARTTEEFEEMSIELQACEFIEDSFDSWRLAGRLMFELRRAGESIPFPDAVIAALAINGGHVVLTHDDHFTRVPGLQLHEASSV